MAKAYPSLNGDPCASNFERQVIDDLIQRGVPYGYECRVGEAKKFRLVYETPVNRGKCNVCGAGRPEVVQQRSYTPDIHLANGIIVEAKGKFIASKRELMRNVVKCHPQVDLRFVFMRDNWLVARTKKRRYSDWARALGVKFVIGTSIPQEWVDA